MEESKLARDHAGNEHPERIDATWPAVPGARELRRLSDLELALAAGGEETPHWP